MNPLDRLVSWVSPQAGLSRVRARTALNLIDSAARSYEGAKRRRGNGKAPSSSANSEIGPAHVELRNRARSLVRNNPHCARVVDILTGNIVGSGIIPVSKTGEPQLDAQVAALWSAFSETCDADGQLDFYGLQALAIREMVEAGEVLVRFRTRRQEDRLPVPLQLQMLEADHIDSSKDGPLQGSRTVLGVEFDGIGRRSAYWLYPEHPGEFRQLRSLQSVRVEAGEIAHLYRKQRAGQVRGVTAFAPVVMMSRDLADFHEAAIVKARIEACFAGFVINQEGERPTVGTSSGTDAGQRVQTIEPGMLNYLEPGEDITFAQPTASPVFDSFMIHTLMAIAVGAGVTYDQLTGDLRQANYSSLRAGKIEFRRLNEQTQHQVFIPMFCAPAWRRFIEMAVTSGKLPRRQGGYPCDWITPANEPIDPVKDLTADILAVRSGRMTFDQFVASWGNDPATQISEIDRINKQLDAAGIVLDIDPRKVARTGSAQASQSAPSDPPAAE